MDTAWAQQAARACVLSDETAGQALEKARKLERFHLARVAFWWLLNVPLVTLAFIFARAVWLEVSVLYLVYVSLYANGATDLGNWQGARAERRGIENPPPE